MKKNIIFIIAILYSVCSEACSSCNIEYTDAEIKAFGIATGLMIILPFTAVYLLYKYLKKIYK